MLTEDQSTTYITETTGKELNSVISGLKADTSPRLATYLVVRNFATSVDTHLHPSRH